MIEKAGCALLVAGVLWSLPTYQPHATPRGLALINIGIFCIVLGGLIRWFEAKK